MPGPETKTTAPKKMTFESGFISDTESLPAMDGFDADNMSYMGGAQKSDEEIQQQEAVAGGVRQTLKEQLKRTNQDSLDAANEMADKHRSHFENSMQGAINSAMIAVQNYHLALAAYEVAMVRSGITGASEAKNILSPYKDAASNGGSTENLRQFEQAQQNLDYYEHHPVSLARSIFTGTGLRRMYRASRLNSKRKSAENRIEYIRRASQEWDNTLKDYKENTYKPLYDQYDKVAMMYYAMSRDVDNIGFKRTGDEGYDPEKDVYAKDIAEYVGCYDNTAITNYINVLMPNGGGAGNPYTRDHHIAMVFDEARALKDESSTNRVDTAGRLKFHTKISTEAFGDENVHSVTDEQDAVNIAPRRRIKVLSDFTGYAARNQEKTDDAPDVLDFQKNVQELENLNLTIDEKDRTGKYLFSNKSAKIYTVKKGDRDVNGFVLNGKFVSEDNNLVMDQNDPEITKHPSWKEAANMETVRTQIRRSDFFRHVNAATIQHYARYDGYDNDDIKYVEKKELEFGGQDKFMAKRDGFFSLTNLGQNALNGNIAGLVDSAIGVTNDVSSSIQGDKDAVIIDKSFASIEDLQNGIMGLGEDASLSSVNTVLDGIVAASDISGGLGLGELPLVGSLSTVFKTIKVLTDIVDTIKKTRAEKGKKAANTLKLLELFLKFGNNVVSILSDISKDVFASTVSIMAIIRDAVGGLISAIKAAVSIYNHVQIRKSEKDLSTALDDFRNNSDDEERRKLGEAVSKNSQSQFFLSLSRVQNRREGIKAGFDVVSKGVNLAGNLTGLNEVAAWFNPISFPFKLASKVVDAISFFADKFQGWRQRKSIVNDILGNGDYDSLSGFDKVLKEETGINNKHYLTDLSRVFMAIDLHALVTKKADSPAQQSLAVKTLNNVIPYEEGMTFAEYRALIKLERLFEAVGAPGNWRAVLMQSISG